MTYRLGGGRSIQLSYGACAADMAGFGAGLQDSWLKLCDLAAIPIADFTGGHPGDTIMAADIVQQSL